MSGWRRSSLTLDTTLDTHTSTILSPEGIPRTVKDLLTNLDDLIEVDVALRRCRCPVVYRPLGVIVRLCAFAHAGAG